jgi:hypothetical protein
MNSSSLAAKFSRRFDMFRSPGWTNQSFQLFGGRPLFFQTSFGEFDGLAFLKYVRNSFVSSLLFSLLDWIYLAVFLKTATDLKNLISGNSIFRINTPLTLLNCTLMKYCSKQKWGPAQEPAFHTFTVNNSIVRVNHMEAISSTTVWHWEKCTNTSSKATDVCRLLDSVYNLPRADKTPTLYFTIK